MEYSENKIITNFANEVGPGVLQSSVQQKSPARFPNKKDRTETKPTLFALDILAAGMFIER